MATSALRLDGVTYRYGDRTALSGLSFSVAPGEAVGYLGPNGAGKSTTLKLVAGVLRPTSGTVEILGAAAGVDARAHLGALIETPGVPPYLRGADVLEYVAAVRGMPPLDRAEAVRRASAALGVHERLGTPVGELSTGLHRRLLIAAALVGDPEILVLDEPTLGLDPLARHDLREALRALRASGRTLLVSTHLLDDVEAVCDRVLFLRDGRLVGDEPVREGGPSNAPGDRRTVILQFAKRVPPSAVRALLGPDESVTDSAETELAVELPGDDLRQAEMIAAIVGAQLPLVGARPARDRLTQRYLQAVGREDP